jgi:hypothetical protein
MVASRNQMHVMSRAFGSTPNGSLQAYGAAGEMQSYLNGRKQVSLRGLGAGPKPMMNPVTRGEIMDRQEFATKDAWVGCFVVKNAQGYYVVETCYKGKCSVKGKYPTMEEAKEAANKCAFNFRHTGKASSISGLGSIGGLFDGQTFGVSNTMIAAATIMYIGADFPGARPALKQASKVFNEPVPFVQNVFLLGGLAVLMYGLGTGTTRRTF